MGVFLHPLLHSCIDRINVTLSGGELGRVKGVGLKCYLDQNQWFE